MSSIRLALPADAEAIAAIYAPIVRETPISFEAEPPSADEFRARMAKIQARFPWLVWDDGRVGGYAYASPHRDRVAYQWSVEVSVYIAERRRRSGVARALYAELFRRLVAQGLYNAYAGITLPNAPSVGLHEALGFRLVGVYEKIGWKMGQWHDVGWWQKELQPRVEAPEPPRQP